MTPEIAEELRNFKAEHRELRDIIITSKEDRRTYVSQMTRQDEMNTVLTCVGCGVEKGDFNDTSFKICSLCKYDRVCPSKNWLDNFFVNERIEA